MVEYIGSVGLSMHNVIALWDAQYIMNIYRDYLDPESMREAKKDMANILDVKSEKAGLQIVMNMHYQYHNER